MSVVLCPKCHMIHRPDLDCPEDREHSRQPLDPTAPLIDIAVVVMARHGAVYQTTIQQPQLTCPCQGTKLLGCEWLYKREPRCTCSKQTDDFTMVLHEMTCDSVPCPFCPLEYEKRHTFEGEE